MSAMRAYTVQEVVDLRHVVECRWLYGTYRPRGGCSRPYREADKAKAVEERVRTHMLAGHTARDLIDWERQSGMGQPFHAKARR